MRDLFVCEYFFLFFSPSLYIVKKPFRRKRRGKKEASFEKHRRGSERQEKNKMRMMSRLFFFTKQTRAKTPVHKQSRERESFYSQTYLFVSYLFVPEEEERRKRGKTIGKERKFGSSPSL